MRVLDVKGEGQVRVELAVVVEIGEIPDACEGVKVFEAGDHAVVFALVGMPGDVLGGVDQDAQVVCVEVGGLRADVHEGDFAFAVHVGDGFWPWGDYLDEDVVVEDGEGFPVDKAVDA